MTRQYLAAGIGSPEQYSRIWSGFDLRPFLEARNDPDLRARYGLAPDDIVVGTIARLFKLKGHDDLFAAAPQIVARCPKVKFLLVGDGAFRERFESLARSLRLERNFVFTGLVRPDEVPPLIGIMDLLVHLSRREGLARALPQALAAGKPVLAYDCDGANEICLDQTTGFLVPAGKTEQVADRVLRLAREPGLRAQFGARGKALVESRFSVDKMVNDLDALYGRLRAASRQPRPK